MLSLTNDGISLSRKTDPPISQRRRLELDANITVYTFEDSREHRRNAYPMAAMGWEIATLGDNFNAFKTVMQDVFFNFEEVRPLL